MQHQLAEPASVPQVQPVRSAPQDHAVRDTADDNGSNDHHALLAPVHPDERRPAVVASDGSSWS